MTDKLEQRIDEERNDFLVACEAVAVRTADEYEQAGQMYLHGKQLEKQIRDYFREPKAKAKAAHSALCQLEKDELAKVQPGLVALNAAMETYDAEQLRLRVEQEARERRKAEEQRLEAAAKLEAAGMQASAEAALAEAASASIVPGIPPKAEQPKVEGMAVVRTWDFKVTDELALAREFLMPDVQAIRKVVRAHGDKAVDIVGPGIEVFQRTTRKATGR